ncbi:two-component sensor histidine kinase [Microbispora corallina]|uniref:Oxygen sensor histidine kinase NreB n=1 Tax=Microbispora corallina TaxID=83302 RepID=A0ABQ4FQE7_9ACTN|nr:histidine kinase [Microbispora corallina]GIH37054.1 two-component sensor histidine kinase [Microbispora corallina]
MAESTSPEVLVRSPALLQVYESRLRELASPVVQDPLVWREWRRQTESLLELCAESGGGRPARAAIEPPSPAVRAVGLVAASAAWAELFQAVADHLAGTAWDPVERERPRDHVLPALNRAILTLVGAFGAEAEAETLDRIGAEQERIRMVVARDVHDWVGSSISLAMRRLDLYELRRGTPEAQDDLRQVRQALNEAWETVRRLVKGLRPWPPRIGLEGSLRAFAEAVKPPGVGLEVSVRGEESSLPVDVRAELLAIIREALRNALAHAGAGGVSAHAEILPGKVVAVVQDDGAGLDPGRAWHGAGLASMRERTELLAGEFRMSSHPSGGTRIDISVPLGGRPHEH